MTPRTEQQLLDATIDLATRCRWAVHHDRPARRGDEEVRDGPKWHTAIQGHAGFPDLVLARRGVVLIRELKAFDSRGRLGVLSSEQWAWAKQIDPRWHPDRATDLGAALGFYDRAGLLFDTWTPDDWPLIVATLTTKIGARA